jgi:CheY-like chemotaxis protein
MKLLNQVLIIDDDVVNNMFCQIVIEYVGIARNVHTCLSGPEAFDYLATCVSNGENGPDLILLDINMPFMSGLEFLKRYHELGYHKILPAKISMLSSSDVESDVKAALKYESVVDYVMKPLSEESLERLIFKLNRTS